MFQDEFFFCWWLFCRLLDNFQNSTQSCQFCLLQIAWGWEGSHFNGAWNGSSNKIPTDLKPSGQASSRKWGSSRALVKQKGWFRDKGTSWSTCKSLQKQLDPTTAPPNLVGFTCSLNTCSCLLYSLGWPMGMKVTLWNFYKRCMEIVVDFCSLFCVYFDVLRYFHTLLRPWTFCRNNSFLCARAYPGDELSKWVSWPVIFSKLPTCQQR